MFIHEISKWLNFRLRDYLKMAREYVSRMDNQRENQLEMDWATCGLQGLAGNLGSVTLLETNMETQKGLYKDYSPSKRGLYEFPCLFGSV